MGSICTGCLAGGGDVDLLMDVLKAYRIHYSNMPLKTYAWYIGATVTVAAGLLLLETIWVGWDRSSLKRLLVRPSRSARTDIAFCLFYLINLTPLLVVVFSFGLAFLIPVSVKRFFGHGLLTHIPNPAVQVFVYLMVYDLLSYWMHRLSHEHDWWWQVHETHHSATELNMITSNRLHPLGEAYGKLFTCLPLAVLGAPPSLYLAFRVLHFVQFLLLHSNFRWQWGWIGRYVIVPPANHHIHHSDLPQHRNKNYGNLTPLWDRMFGTYYAAIGDEIRIDDRPHFNHRSWLTDLWSAYARSLKTLTRRVRGIR